jgi:prepilin-type N-terminal cleavage/methylation domain-containing protein
MPTRRGAVTVIEVLMVVVIIAILAAIAYPRFSGNPARRATYDARAALERLKDAEDRYYSSHRKYTTDLKALDFASSSDVQVTVGGAGLDAGTGWNAMATTSGAAPVKCYIGVGADSVVGWDAVHAANGAIVCP